LSASRRIIDKISLKLKNGIQQKQQQ
jgi:hypothetical protein